MQESCEVHFPINSIRNRIYLKEIIEQKSTPFTMVLLNIRQFKRLNLLLGHEAGDLLLLYLYQMITHYFDDANVIHMYADHFMLIFNTKIDHKEVEERLVTLQDEYCTHMSFDEHKVSLKFYCGAIDVVESLEYNYLLQALELTKKEAKKQIRIIVFFIDKYKKIIEENLHMERLVKKVKEKELFYVHYQPIVDVKGTICRYEALLRVKDHKVNIGRVIEVLEKNHQIQEVGFFVLKESIMYSAKKQVKVTINVSLLQLYDDDFLDRLIACCKEYNVDPLYIGLELTEGLLIENMNEISSTLYAIKAAGFTLLLDDFGTGYSSLEYFMELPMDIVKISKCFVDHVDEQKKCEFLNYLVSMIHLCNKKVIVEGIENQVQLECLQTIGVDEYQGFYFSK